MYLTNCGFLIDCCMNRLRRVYAGCTVRMVTKPIPRESHHTKRLLSISKQLVGHHPMACVPRCPICYDPIREPVVFPCGHEICRECFDHSLKTANFYCPLCRKRVSSWARRHARDPVDRRRKKELELRMSELQEQRTTSEDGGCSYNVWKLHTDP